LKRLHLGFALTMPAVPFILMYPPSMVKVIDICSPEPVIRHNSTFHDTWQAAARTAYSILFFLSCLFRIDLQSTLFLSIDDIIQSSLHNTIIRWEEAWSISRIRATWETKMIRKKDCRYIDRTSKNRHISKASIQCSKYQAKNNIILETFIKKEQILKFMSKRRDYKSDRCI